MSKRFRLFLGLIVMPALAVVASIASLSTILVDALPARAMALPIVDPNAYASQALQEVSGTGGAGQESLQHALAAGRRTFNAEPTNATAISLMGLGTETTDLSAARKLYGDALLVAKRNRLANLWLLEDASQNGRIGYILNRYDVLLRTGGAASDLLFSVMGSALREQAIVPYLESRLLRRPPWAEQFWLKVTPNRGAIANVGRLRLLLLDQGVENAAGNDGEIVQRLTDAGEYDLAFQLFNRLTAGVNPREPVQNEEFRRFARFAPLDWETFSESASGAEVDPAAGALVLYSEDPAGAIVARQLIAAAPGRYTLRYRVLDTQPLHSVRTSLRARCVTGGAELLSLPIDADSGSKAILIPESGCRHVWLEVWGQHNSTVAEPVESDVYIDSITMRRISAR